MYMQALDIFQSINQMPIIKQSDQEGTVKQMPDSSQQSEESFPFWQDEETDEEEDLDADSVAAPQLDHQQFMSLLKLLGHTTPRHLLVYTHHADFSIPSQ